MNQSAGRAPYGTGGAIVGEAAWLSFVGGDGAVFTKDGGPSFSFFVLGLPHVTLIELRLALISYQDYHMLLLTLAGLQRGPRAVLRRRVGQPS